MIRWCVFISGRGSNLAAAIEECRETGPEIALVVSSAENAPGLAKARRAGIPTLIAPVQPSGESEKSKIDWTKLDKLLREARIDAVFLLGFMRIVPPSFIEKWRGRILNLHPSLLPAFPGLKSIERAVSAGAELGATVHHVEAEVDAGAVVRRSSAGYASELPKAELLVHRSEQILVRGIFSRMRLLKAGRE